METSTHPTTDDDSGRSRVRRVASERRAMGPDRLKRATSLQEKNLGLRPWEIAPASIDDIEASLAIEGTDHRGHRRAATMLRRMLALGLSKWEPDPRRNKNPRAN